MNIYYTREFLEDISKETKRIQLSKYGLKNKTLGFDTLEKVTTEDEIKSSPIDGYYIAQGVKFGEKGIQLSLDVPSTDSSFYNAGDSVNKLESYYQAIIFYYTDLTSLSPDKVKTAFILYENFDNGSFSKLNLSTLKNIITIRELPNKKCELIFEQSDVTEFLESESLYVPTTRTGEGNSYTSRDYIETKLDTEYNEDSQPYFGTVRINKYGLKIY